MTMTTAKPGSCQFQYADPSYPPCGKPVRAKGLCSMHYTRVWERKRTNASRPKQPPQHECAVCGKATQRPRSPFGTTLTLCAPCYTSFRLWADRRRRGLQAVPRARKPT